MRPWRAQAGGGADSSGEAGEQEKDPGEMVRVSHRGPDGGSHRPLLWVSASLVEMDGLPIIIAYLMRLGFLKYLSGFRKCN